MWPRASSWWQFTSVQDGTIRAWESHMKSEAWPARDLQMTWNSLSFDENHRGSKHTVIQEPTSWQPNLNDPDISSVVPFLFFFFLPVKNTTHKDIHAGRFLSIPNWLAPTAVRMSDCSAIDEAGGRCPQRNHSQLSRRSSCSRHVQSAGSPLPSQWNLPPVQENFENMTITNTEIIALLEKNYHKQIISPTCSVCLCKDVWS